MSPPLISVPICEINKRMQGEDCHTKSCIEAETLKNTATFLV
jgi:hypothetical protein